MTAEFISARKIDGQLGPQVRAKINEEVVKEYLQEKCDGAKFPPIDLFWSNEHNVYVIADGIHRFEADCRKGEALIHAVVHEGGEREALAFALQSNAKHGLRRTAADTRVVITTMLNDSEWGKWSNVRIGEFLGVSEKTIRNYRKELEPDVGTDSTKTEENEQARTKSDPEEKPQKNGESGESESEPMKVIGRDGKEYPAKAKKSKVEPKGGGKEVIAPAQRTETKKVWGQFIRLTDKVPAWKELIAPEVSSISLKMKEHWSRGGK